MSALDGRRNPGRKPMSDDTRALLAQRGREMQDRIRGFSIPPELKDKAKKVQQDWHNQNRGKGRMPAELYKAALGLCFLLALVIPAEPHSWYSSTEDPVTKQGCCGGQDCKEISDDDVREQPGGAFLYVPTGEVIPAPRVQQSRDFRFHRCEYLGAFWPHKKGETRCFFVPPGSF